MSVHDVDSIRQTMQVRWDPMRERRVLGTTLDRCERRAKRRRAASIAIATAFVVLLLHVLPQMHPRGDDSGGFAGSGERSGGRRSNAGNGGNAGTG